MTTRQMTPPIIARPAPPIVRATPPVSAELAADLARLEHEQQVELDRRRQAELARLRAVQSYD